MSPSLMWVTVAIIVSYLIVQDANVVEWLALQNKLLSVSFRRLWFLVCHHPETPWVRLKSRWNADRIARQLIKEREEQ